MKSNATVSITEARKHIFDIADAVQTPGNYYTLTEKGQPKAVVLSSEEYESLIETLEVLRAFPDLETDIAQARKDYKEGNFITLDQLVSKKDGAQRGKNKHDSHRSRKGS